MLTRHVGSPAQPEPLLTLHDPRHRRRCQLPRACRDPRCVTQATLTALALQVQDAKDRVQAKVQEVQARSASKGAGQAAVGVPPGMMGHVIGKAGVSIKAIATTSGARLSVDASGARGALIAQGTEQQVRRLCVRGGQTWWGFERGGMEVRGREGRGGARPGGGSSMCQQARTGGVQGRESGGEWGQRPWRR